MGSPVVWILTARLPWPKLPGGQPRLADRSLGWEEWGVQEGRGIRLCAQAPSAVWLTAQHPALQLFSLVRVDTKARPPVFIFLQRVPSAVSLPVPETGEKVLTVSPVASLEGPRVCAVTLFFGL